MKQFFIELFEYSHHCNQKLGESMISNLIKKSEKAIELYCHIINAHQIWNNRIVPHQQTFGVWEIHSIKDCIEIDQTNYQQSLHLLEKSDLSDIINYVNSKGNTFNNSIRDVFFHIINHSTYHRGQIATEFRRMSLDPLATDYIFYKR